MKIKNLLQITTLIISICLGGISIWLFINPEKEGMDRQHIEESMADEYLEYLLQAEVSNIPATQDVEFQTELNLESMAEPMHETEEEKTETWQDVNYYTDTAGTTYTPEYAAGVIAGVLEIETAEIRRGVYTGSWTEIQHDLDIWMVTTARPDYVLGKTHYCIYGHNHTVQNLSFNRLKDVKIGDVFTYTTNQGVYIYDTTNFFADWRETVTEKYVDNFELPKDKIYLITCGRNEYRYKDIVIEGTLRDIINLTDYNKNPDYYKYEYNPNNR